MPLLKYYDTATSQWLPILAGAKGETGDTGPIGPQGPAGLGSVAVSSPITNSGTSTSAVIGINQSALSLDTARITSGRFTAARLPVGSVAQVVSTTKRDLWAVSADPVGFYEVGGYSASITPSSAGSKILVRGMIHVSSWYWEIQGRILRNGTTITDAIGNARGSRARATFTQNLYEGTGSVRNSWAPVTFEYLDSPGTTSSVSYSVALGTYGYGLVGVNYNVYSDPDTADYFATPISTITLMEIL
jgi:hypothetical protein